MNYLSTFFFLQLMFTAEGTPFMAAIGTRKTSRANVTVYGRGSGRITINGEDILYYKNIQDREQVSVNYCNTLQVCY